MNMPALDSIWKAADGRRLRVVGADPVYKNRVGVRNVESNRLSYVNIRYFNGARDGNWWLEPEPVVNVAPQEGTREMSRPTDELIRKLLNEIPTNWCDSMLTGPNAVIGKPPFGCPDIEALLHAIRARITDAYEALAVPPAPPSGWQDMSSAPKNAKWFIGLMPNDEVCRVHWASNLSGEEQPAFQGFFRGNEKFGGFESCEPIAWMPLPPAPLAATKGET